MLSDQWEYMVHYYDQEKNIWLVQFRYAINEEVVTNRLITCSYENGKINQIAYSNISKSVNEEHIITRVDSFKNKYTQEKKLKDDEEFISEIIEYTYNYNVDKLIYVYNLFFYKGQYELRIIDNDTVSEHFIDEDGDAIA